MLENPDQHVTLSEVVAAEYEVLHSIASSCFRHERKGHTLQATAVLHEAYLSVSKSVENTPGPRLYYLAAMARGIRQVLVSHARRRNALKRGGGRLRFEPPRLATGQESSVDLCALDDAINSLEREHERSAQVVELRFFGGLSNKQISDWLGVSTRTVQVDWQFARAWLTQEMSNSE